MNTTFLIVTNKSIEINSTINYTIGAVITLFLLGYLIYSLIKPEKF